MAISAVSLSRISPTMMMSGSCRRKLRRPEAKVRPIFGLIGIWLMPLSWYSTGSSTVRIFTSGVLMRGERPVERGGLARAGGAGDQHDAVAAADELVDVAQDGRVHADLGQVEQRGALVEQTHDDALAVHRGNGGHADVDVAAGELDLMRPSCGSRFSAMFSCAMIFTRLMIEFW